MLPPATGFTKAALDLLFPPYCIGCGREGSYICDRCRAELSFISPPVCAVCGRPLGPDNRCPGCISQPSSLDGIRAPFTFNGLVRRAIHALKYNNLRAAAPALASFLFDYLKDNPLPGDVLLPVPIHAKRLRERGYNQTVLMAKELGRLTDLPAVANCLVRRSYHQPQARAASAADRLASVADAFACANDRLKGKKVILIDDVSTSGATLNACAGALKSAGAESVWGLVLALEL